MSKKKETKEESLVTMVKGDAEMKCNPSPESIKQLEKFGWKKAK